MLLIADEVAVGFGRTGKMFACEQEGVSPDLLVLAKGITGGYLPLAATLTTDEIWQAFLGTYAESKTLLPRPHLRRQSAGRRGVAGLARSFREEQTLVQLSPRSPAWPNIWPGSASCPHVGDVRQCGLIAGIELVRDRQTREPYPWSEQRGLKACEVAREHGVLLRPLGNVLVIMPPLAISLAEVDRICAAVAEGIRQVPP